MEHEITWYYNRINNFLIIWTSQVTAYPITSVQHAQYTLGSFMVIENYVIIKNICHSRFLFMLGLSIHILPTIWVALSTNLWSKKGIVCIIYSSRRSLFASALGSYGASIHPQCTTLVPCAPFTLRQSSNLGYCPIKQGTSDVHQNILLFHNSSGTRTLHNLKIMSPDLYPMCHTCSR